jgi:hypothetical protein
MKFEIENKVKWTNDCPIRLLKTSDSSPAQHCEIVFAFDNEDVFHGAAQRWFEPVSLELRASELGRAEC